MQVYLLIFSVFLSFFALPASAAERRIVSTSLCGDTYVLWLAEQADIAALSWQSGDALSSSPQSFNEKPKAWDDPERLLSLNPTLVVFGPGEGSVSKPLLDKAGIKYTALIWGEDFAALQINAATIAQAMNKTPKQIDLPAVKASSPVLTLYISASGGTAGKNTYVDAAIRAAGGVNIITKQGWYTPDPETFVSLKPDLIITSFFKDGYASVNEAGMRNRVLQNMIKSTPHINIPGKLWPCAGPGLVKAVNLIAGAIENLP